MRILRRLVRSVVLIVLLAVGGGVLAVALVPGRWADMQAIDNGREVWVWIGGTLLTTALLFVLSEYRTRRKERFLSFDNEGGTVTISTEAMADYIAKLSGEFPSIVRMRPMVRPSRRGVDLLVHVKVRAGSQVHEMCEALQQRVRERVVDGLGITEVRRVEVSVRDIVSEHKPV